MINTTNRRPEEIKAALSFCTAGNELPKCNTACPYLNIGNCWAAVMRDSLILVERLESERDAAIAKIPKWIRVKDKLPPREHKVLTVDGHGCIRMLAFWKKEKERWTWIEDLCFTHRNDITHWMPLPEPPKEV